MRTLSRSMPGQTAVSGESACARSTTRTPARAITRASRCTIATAPATPLRVRHREVGDRQAALLGERERAARERDRRLRAPDDLDLAPREVDAAAERLADRLLAREAAPRSSARVRLDVAVGALGLGVDALAEARALERPRDALDLDQVHADEHGSMLVDRFRAARRSSVSRSFSDGSSTTAASSAAQRRADRRALARRPAAIRSSPRTARSPSATGLLPLLLDERLEALARRELARRGIGNAAPGAVPAAQREQVAARLAPDAREERARAAARDGSRSSS